MRKKAMLLAAATPALFVFGGCGGFSWATVHDIAVHLNEIVQFAAAFQQLSGA